MAKKAWKELEGQFFRIDVGSTQAEALASEESNVLYITTEQSLVMNGEVVAMGNITGGSGGGDDESYIRLMCSTNVTTTPVATADGKDVSLGTYGNFKVECNGNFAMKTLPAAVVGIDLTHWHPNSLTSLAKAFYNMSNVTRLNMSKVDVSNVTDMNSAFYGMSKLEEIDVSTWDTRKATSMNFMFSLCSKLKVLDLQSFCLSGITKTSASILPSNSSVERILLGPKFFDSPVITTAALNSSAWTDTTSITLSLYTNLFDRKTAGQPTLALSLSTATKAALTDAQKTRLTDYGYTLS